MKSKSQMVIWIGAAVAILFGILTIKSGGQVLFGSEEARLAAGNYIPQVLWFNFVAGFGYIIAGIGIALQKQWGMWLALTLMISTAIVFVAMGLGIFFADIAYEMRTVVAMTIRTVVWSALFMLAYKQWLTQSEPLIQEK